MSTGRENEQLPFLNWFVGAKLSDAIGGSLIFALPFLIAGIVLLFRK